MGEREELAARIHSCQSGPLDRMELVNFQGIYRQLGYQVGRFEKALPCLARETVNEVGAYIDPLPCKSLNSREVFGEPMSAIDPREDSVIHRLEPEFHADVAGAGEFFQEVDRIIGQTIRTGSDGDADGIRIDKSTPVKALQLVQRGVSIGVFLEIDNEFDAAESESVVRNTLCNLGFDRNVLLGALWRKGVVVAENTAAGTFDAVPVRAGESAVHIDFTDAAVKAAAQVEAIGINAEVVVDQVAGHFKAGSRAGTKAWQPPLPVLLP